MKRLLFLLLILSILTSCVYFDADRDDILERLGEKGDAVITLDTERMKETSLSSFIPSGELGERTSRLTIELASDGSLTGIAQGRLSSTEVGTALIWSPVFHRARGSNPEYYEGDGLSVGSAGEGIVLFTTGDYKAEYASIFSDGNGMIAEEDASLMLSSLASLYIDSPETSYSLDLPEETVEKMENVLLLLDEEDGKLLLSGRIITDSEDSARSLQILLRNMLVQSIRRKGERLDVKALSGIFTYKGSVVSITDYPLDKNDLESILSGSVYAIV